MYIGYSQPGDKIKIIFLKNLRSSILNLTQSGFYVNIPTLKKIYGQSIKINTRCWFNWINKNNENVNTASPITLHIFSIFYFLLSFNTFTLRKINYNPLLKNSWWVDVSVGFCLFFVCWSLISGLGAGIQQELGSRVPAQHLPRYRARYR